MTNLLLITLVLTNWVNVPGDWMREGQTNYVKQRLLVQTNTFVVESHICYTSNLVHQASDTNGATRWLAVGVNAVPPLPGVMQKP